MYYLTHCRPIDKWKVLGHILVHEIVHVLEGTGRHSEIGLMKARWSGEDFRDITGTGLDLASEDCLLLRTLFSPTLANVDQGRFRAAHGCGPRYRVNGTISNTLDFANGFWPRVKLRAN